MGVSVDYASAQEWLINNNNRCPNGEDYSPCFCSRVFATLPIVICQGATMAQVSSIFNRTIPADWDSFTIYLEDRNEIIPIDFLGHHRINRLIDITCGSSNNILLRADPQAFRSSRNTTKLIYFFHCDLSRLDFHFLYGFDQLT